MQEGKFIQRVRAFQPGFPDWLLNLALAIVIISVPTVPTMVYLGWVKITYIEFLNGMAWQSKFKAQSESPFFEDGQSYRAPVDGTQPQGFHAYPNWGKTAEELTAEEALENPLPFNAETVKRGERLYGTFCVQCHGKFGIGDGLAVGPGKLPAPLSLQSTKAREYTDGQIFHILTVGQNDKMPSLAAQIPALDRWALIHYMRALQRSQNPNPDEVERNAAATRADSKTTSATEELQENAE